jgi:predicted ferric reductase
MHMLAGKAMFGMGIVHAVAHMLGTVPAMIHKTAAELNEVLGCSRAAEGDSPYWVPANLDFLKWPRCPMERAPTSVGGVLLTMPGFTGVLLLLLLVLIAYTAKEKQRRQNFDRFWYVHNVAITSWPVLLFLHGSQGWLGVGLPLVVFTASLPIALYAVDRVKRLLRYYLFAGKAVQIEEVMIRPGKNGGADGALTSLAISTPPGLWKFRPGMYAFINMPEYAPGQWHPFTICSGADDKTVNFIIAGVGDWTQELATRCLAVRDGTGQLPIVALDGPYTAPTQGALEKKVIVAVGAGVGVTPFISLMSTIISQLEEDSKAEDFPLVEAHFYWLSRSADEFLFGRKHLSKIVRNESLKYKVFLHLHLTAREPEKDAPAFLFREAVKRQSAVDRAAHQATVAAMQEANQQFALGPQLPWCWTGGAKQDVMWVKELAREEDGDRACQRTFKSFKSFADVAKAPQVGIIDETVEKRSNASGSSSDDVSWMVPIVFGRPDFAAEIRAIGKARPGTNVHVYVCGNDAVVQNLQEVCIGCTREAEEGTRTRGLLPQRYDLHFERFG